MKVKPKYCNLKLLSKHAPTEEKGEVGKEEFNSSLGKVGDAGPNYDCTREFNAKVGRESYLYPACGEHSLHIKTNDNGKGMVDFALGRDLAVTRKWYQNKDIHNVTWRSPNSKTRN